MLECVLAATPYGAKDERRLFVDYPKAFQGSMAASCELHGQTGSSFTASAAPGKWKRCQKTLEPLGIDPLMSEAAARRQDWCAKLGISKTIRTGRTEDFRESA